MADLRIRAGATRSPQRGGGHSAALSLVTLLSALLTCGVRCAESEKPSNIILVLVDDQDVQIGGMVSEFTLEIYNLSFVSVPQRLDSFCSEVMQCSYCLKRPVYGHLILSLDKHMLYFLSVLRASSQI